MTIPQIVEKQRIYFQSGATLPVNHRIAALKRLYAAIEAHEAEIFEALQADLGKSDFETYLCEVGMMRAEISYLIRNTRKFAKAQKVKTPLAQFPSRSYKQPTPYGNVLIMSPWNYPFLLTLEPLADAIAAGNTAVIKPSAYSPATSALVAKLVAEVFPPEEVTVITGGRAENAALLEQKFDLIFFTGSQAVGKEVLRHAAENLTPAILELGGKSPCIVDSSAKIGLAARRIAFGKYLNCGQTCVAPDYILCHESVKEELKDALISEIARQFGKDPLQNPDYGRIVNRKHFDRLLGLIDPAKVICGGYSDPSALRIAPTVLYNVTPDDAVMQEEIFGPILPILTFREYSDVYAYLDKGQKPLALYLFAEDKQRIAEVTTRVRYGGGCVNDTIIHLATSELPFGGVGESGMGAYHGKDGFDAFTHYKGIVHKKTWLDLAMRYQPYDRKAALKTIRKHLK